MNYLTFHAGEQAIGQLEKIKGGYFYLTIEAAVINQFERKRHTRLVCHLDEKISFQCGLNHLGDGNFSSLLRVNISNN
jgi:predicted DNA-binding ribbon-helix-helix protein